MKKKLEASVKISFFSLLVLILPILAYPKTEAINLTPGELYNRLGKYLGERRNKEWAKYQGKVVHWTGNPIAFGTRGITDQGVVIDLSFKAKLGYVWIRVYFPEEEAERLLKLSQYDAVEFEGKLADYTGTSWGAEYHFLVKEAKLISIIRARSSLSIIDYRLLVQPSPLTGSYEFLGFSVILRNDGNLPLRDAFLQVDFGHLSGKKSVFVGPKKTEEIGMWLVQEWTVNGKEKLSPFDIPAGLYKGTIQLIDKNGKLVTSKSFSRRLPPVKRRQLN
ncbi:MAG: hypothetical protein JRJ66_02845 [Deltaproteobacteria bacterium]|nr:hypothetical protein [Deltaproteobacteria bacterium]